MAEKEREGLNEEQDQLIKKTKRQVDAKTRELELTKMEADMKTREAEKEIYDKSRELVWTKMEAELLARKAELYIEELSKLMVKQTDRGIIVTLGDVLFTPGKAALSPNADDKVDKLFEFMKKYENINVLVEGYTDSVGTVKANIALSQERADAVKARLVDRGISPDRIATRGYGKKYPTAGNNTIAGRNKNRRVEVLLLREGVKPESKFRK
jgi:outer membrane protein OmpA-like peptidoglycan-associated protein